MVQLLIPNCISLFLSPLLVTASNFSHSSMITPRPLLRVIISVLASSTESVSDISLGGENPCLIISTSMILATIDSINSTGIPFHRQSKRSTN